jgi:hypothetical protein
MLRNSTVFNVRSVEQALVPVGIVRFPVSDLISTPFAWPKPISRSLIAMGIAGSARFDGNFVRSISTAWEPQRIEDRDPNAGKTHLLLENKLFLRDSRSKGPVHRLKAEIPQNANSC